MKADGKKVAWITSYDFPTAQFVEAAGLDMILVGDSMGMCVYGYGSTVPVTMDQCIVHTEAVRRGAPSVFVVGDMPLGSYQVSDEDAVRNAIRFLKEADVDAIKLEGGARVASRIRAITDAGACSPLVGSQVCNGNAPALVIAAVRSSKKATIDNFEVVARPISVITNVPESAHTISTPSRKAASDAPIIAKLFVAAKFEFLPPVFIKM